MAFAAAVILLGPLQAMAVRPLGIDVSHWQGTFNWTNAKNANVEFAYCKATQGTTYTDTEFVNNQKGAPKVGIPIGAYHFPQYDVNTTTNGAVAEANYFWSVIKAYVKADGTRLMPMLDCENISSTVGPSQAGFNKTTFSLWVVAFCTTLSNNAAAVGITVKPVIYTSSSFAGTWMNSTVTKYIPWIANWSGSPQTGAPSPVSPWSTWVCWQYGSMTIPGYGTVDGDVFNGTSPGIITTLVIGGYPVVLTNQPVSQTLAAGSTVTFTGGASGSTPMYYQWRLNGANIPGATATSYAKSSLQLSDSGSYSVVATNASGSATSSNAVLAVSAPPTITAQPTNVATGPGLSATFRVTATGSAPLIYQWRFNGGALPGATASSLMISNAWSTNAGTYAVVVTNLYGTQPSTNALLAILDPYITNQPQNQMVAVGAPATFTVGALGTAPFRYSWRKDGAPLANGGNISGATNSTLTLASVQVADIGSYSVVVSNVNNRSILSSNATLSAAFAPSIVTQPASQQVPAGSTLSLTVSVIGPGPMSYQWRKDGTNLSDGWRIGGSAAVSLSVSNLQSADMGNYSVVVSNTNGPTTSSNALVALWPLAVWGAGTTNTTTSPNYGQSVIPAGLTNVAAVAGGLYHSLALKANGTVAAWGAGYTNKGVAPQYGQSVVPAGLSNVVQVIGGYYHSLALVADGRLVGWGAGTNNTGASPFYGQLIIPDGLTNVTAAACGGYHSLALKPDGTVAAWGAGTTATGVNPEYGQSIVPAGLAGVVDVAAGGYHNLALKPDGTVVAWGAGAVNTGVTPYYGQSMVPDGLSNVVMTAAGGYHSLALKLDGTVAAWGDNTYGQSSPPAGLSNVVAIAAGRYNSLALKSDGTLATWGAGTNNTGATPNFGQGIIPPGTTNGIALASGGFQSFLLKGDGRPCLTVQPPSQTVAAGANVSYAAMAAGNPPLSYQWKLDGAEIPGATASVLCLTNLQFGGSGQYAVLVSNALGSVTSSNAMLTILSPPVISQQPSDQTAIAGAPVTFTVQAAGSAPLAYQWSFNSASIPGATQSSYSIAAAHPTNAGIYSAVVSNAYGTAPSSSALLAVILPPAITTQPSSQSAAVGGNASFSVQADSATPLNYQWYYGQTNLLAGADEAALSLTNVQPAQAGDYFVVVNNIAGSATSTLATLTVLMPTNILSGPKFTPGGEFQFNVAGNPGSNYVVEGSTNLADWFPLLTNTSPFTFTDADAANLPTRFYRVHQTP